MQDAEDRWWAKHRDTGEWHYYDGNAWVRGTPPGYREATTEPAPTEQPRQTTLPTRPGDAGSEERRRGRSWVLAVGLVGVVGLIAIAVYLLGGNIGGTETAGRSNGVGQPRNESPSGPTPGYNLIQDPSGSLTVEVPSGWGVETGTDSEKEGGPSSWSYYAEEYLTSSITTGSTLEGWYAGEESGAYIVASRGLTQYSDYELTHLLLHENKDANCELGPYEDLDRSDYSGKIQTWYDCGGMDATTFTVAGAPEGRECVVALVARIHSETDSEAIRHIIDSFEVDCGNIAGAEVGGLGIAGVDRANTAPPVG